MPLALLLHISHMSCMVVSYSLFWILASAGHRLLDLSLPLAGYITLAHCLILKACEPTSWLPC